MAKPLRGECEVELAGEKFTLRLQIGDFEELEQLLDIGVIELVDRYIGARRGNRGGGIRIRDSRAVLRQGFVGAGLKITEAKFNELIEFDRTDAMLQAAKLVITAWTLERGNVLAPEADSNSQPQAGAQS